MLIFADQNLTQTTARIVGKITSTHYIYVQNQTHKEATVVDGLCHQEEPWFESSLRSVVGLGRKSTLVEVRKWLNFWLNVPENKWHVVGENFTMFCVNIFMTFHMFNNISSLCEDEIKLS